MDVSGVRLLAEMAAVVAQFGDGAAPARLVVGEGVWPLLRGGLVPSGGRWAEASGAAGLLGTPVVVDSSEVGPLGWMMLDHAGRVLDSGRLG